MRKKELCGEGLAMGENAITFEEELNRSGRLVYTNVGVSMMPLLRQGRDVMLIEKRDPKDLRRFDAVFFKRPGVTGRGAYVMHRILRILPDGNYWIVGDNCTSGEIVPPADILGVLTQVKRDGKKTVHMTDFSYRLYVFFWCRPYYLRFFVLKAGRLVMRILRKIYRFFFRK